LIVSGSGHRGDRRSRDHRLLIFAHNKLKMHAFLLAYFARGTAGEYWRAILGQKLDEREKAERPWGSTSVGQSLRSGRRLKGHGVRMIP
jgi:hypothetical protein